MIPLVLVRWAAARLVRHPLALPLVVVLGGLVPLFVALSPFSGPETARGLFLSWALPVGLVGACSGIALLSAEEELLRRFTPSSRWMGEGAVLATAVGAFQAPLVVGGMLAGAFPDVAASAGAALRVLASDVHLVALAALVLRGPPGGTARVALFVTGVWILPGWVDEGGSAMRWLSGLLDPGVLLRPEVPFVPDLRLALAEASAALALAAVGRCLVVPDTPALPAS